MRNKIVLDPNTSDPNSKSFQKRVARLAEALQELPLDVRAIDSSIPGTLKVYPHLLLPYERVLRPVGVFSEFVIIGPGSADIHFEGITSSARWDNNSFRIWLPRSNSGLFARYVLSLQVPTSRHRKSGELITRYTECAFNFDGRKVNIY